MASFSFSTAAKMVWKENELWPRQLELALSPAGVRSLARSASSALTSAPCISYIECIENLIQGSIAQDSRQGAGGKYTWQFQAAVNGFQHKRGRCLYLEPNLTRRHLILAPNQREPFINGLCLQ